MAGSLIVHVDYTHIVYCMPEPSFSESLRANVIFSQAFRPFFLMVAAYAMFMLLAWAFYLSGVISWPDGLSPRVRHGHEMIFGFAGGAIAGFLLTAVSHWTDRPPIGGGALIGLCAAWALARLGGFLPGQAGWLVWGLSSLIFWGYLLVLMARELVSAGNARNYKALLLLAAFLGTETVFFVFSADHHEWRETCLRIGLFLLLGMIILVGGRIIPTFTQNWLRANRPETDAQIPGFDRVDQTSVALTMLFAIGFIFWPKSAFAGWMGLIAALGQAVRLSRWRGWLAAREPLLWVLHLGFAWIVVGFLLLGASNLWISWLWESGIHALTYGAAGTLILGVASRVSLGHTGRPLQASPLMTLAFTLINVGALSRILAHPGSNLWMTLSVALWLGAFGLFLVQYVPILLAPRVNLS